MFETPIPRLVYGLKLSLIKCQDIPQLFQKVSRLLGILYTLSFSSKPFSELASSNNQLCANQWAAFFHQVSIGTQVSCHLFSLREIEKSENAMDDISKSLPSGSVSLTSHRLVSGSAQELDTFVLNFFQSLPPATIICISILGSEYDSWLSKLFPSEGGHPWIMISRLNSDSAPLVIALPIKSIENPHANRTMSCCPLYQNQIVDQVVPWFRESMEKIDEIARTRATATTSEWLTQTNIVDGNLKKLLGNMEKTWFGDWKYMLLGGLPEVKNINQSLQYKLKLCGIEDENIIKAIMKIGKPQSIKCLSELMVKQGCYIGGRKKHNNKSDSLLSIFKILSKEMADVKNEVIHREPVIMMTDLNIQNN